jgi:L-2,4-diaminobutyrate decarboxylase
MKRGYFSFSIKYFEVIRMMKNLQKLFPSEDGNKADREQLLLLMQKLLEGIDQYKDPNRAVLGQMQERTGDFYKQFIEKCKAPRQGMGLDQVLQKLLQLVPGHPYHTKNFLTNVLPMASIPGILGSLLAVLLNGNNLWDVYGPAGAEAEVKVIAMMSKLAGYDETQSWGYTTWGGQGAVFTGLRIAIAKQFPRAKEEGVPGNLYCFASENAHYSLLKSIEATGIGSHHLITIQCKSDHSMDERDLAVKMEQVVSRGGIPIYVVATTGATDSFGIDNVKEIKRVTDEITQKHGLHPVHIHADSALGGFYCLFNNYDFVKNPLGLEEFVLNGLMKIREKMQYIALADSLCFDFQKLGQTPYLTSLFLVKKGSDLGLLDLQEFETPYVGNRGYGSYHTSYTLECSRMASSIAIYAALLAFGVEGYQQILANYVRVNLAFREKLTQRFPNVSITNDENPGPVTAFRFYPNGQPEWSKEQKGLVSRAQIEATNEWNKTLFEKLGERRDEMFFGDTTRQCLVHTSDSMERCPIAAIKLFSISPYTTVEQLDDVVEFLEKTLELNSKVYALNV